MNSDHSYIKGEMDPDFVDWSVGDLLSDAVSKAPERVALLCPPEPDGKPERRWSYSALAADVRRAARALLEHFEPGDHVATWAGNSAEIVILQLGAAMAGIVLVTLNPALRASEMEYQLRASQSRGIFLDRAFRKSDNAAIVEKLCPLLPELQRLFYLDQWAAFLDDAEETRALPTNLWNARVMILFTSGTTGKPKGVVLRHSGIVNNALLTNARMELTPGSVWLNVAPMFHIGGSVTMTLGAIANVGTLVMPPEFNAERTLHSIQRYCVSFMFMVPTMMYAMFESEQFASTDLSSLKVILAGGTVISPELVRQMRRQFGVDVVVACGQTEAGGCMFVTRRSGTDEQVSTSVGPPLPLSEAKIIDTSSGQITPLGQIGEICLKTRCAMIEYFNMPESTAQTLDSDGWLHTGDLGTIRSDGYVQVTGRLKEMIIRGGENIYPREIEDALAEHPAVLQSAVFGLTDAKWGEQVAAAVILRPGVASNGELLSSFLQERMARYKVPRVWHFVDSLPLNASGKCQKFMLRQRYESRPVSNP